MTSRTNGSNDDNENPRKCRYNKKEFGLEEWKEKVCKDKFCHDFNDESKQEHSNNEPGLLKLLLNYFVVMAYEESAIRLARELKLVHSNKDADDFNKLYKIQERALIRNLIKDGRIADAMDVIVQNFGVSALETFDMERAKTHDGEDLHFKLLLLNLIEMIREYRSQKQPVSPEKSSEFILNLIGYSKEKLALKASTNPKHMEELELTITLLLYPLGADSMLPKRLQNLYSLSLRSRIADLINKKLLEISHPSITNQSKFPDLIGVNNSLVLANKDFANFLDMKSTNQKSNEYKPSHPSETVTESNQYWSHTKSLLSTAEGARDDIGEFQYDAKLIQIMKLWAWCENQLHKNDIGVPRIGNDI